MEGLWRLEVPDQRAQPFLRVAVKERVHSLSKHQRCVPNLFVWCSRQSFSQTRIMMTPLTPRTCCIATPSIFDFSLLNKVYKSSYPSKASGSALLLKYANLAPVKKLVTFCPNGTVYNKLFLQLFY